MVQVTTVHDSELNQKVFKIRGDEGYARHTKVSIAYSETSYDPEMTNYNEFIDVTVYRGIGDSYIAIMDGETTIQLEEWESTSTTETIEVKGLSYDVPHNLSVRYLGNNQCLKSHSNTLDYEPKPNPNLTQTTLTNISTYDYDAVWGGTIKAKLVDDENTPLEGELIDIYVNGEKLNDESLETNSSGEISYTCSTKNNGMPKGLNRVEFVYNGIVSDTKAYAKSNVDFQYSVGLKLRITSYPKVFIVDADNIVTGLVTDYFDRPLSNKTVNFEVGTSPYPSATSDASGILTYTLTWMSDNVAHRLRTSNEDYSDYITTHSTTVSSISINPSTSIVTPNTSSTIDILVNAGTKRRDIKVELSGAINGTYYTDDKSRVTVRYQGTGYGDATITATVGNVTESITIEDLLFYYGNNAPNYSPYRVFSGGIEPRTNGLRFLIPDYSFCLVGLGSGTEEIGDFELTFDYTQSYQTEGLVWNIGTWNTTSGATDTDKYTVPIIPHEGDKFRITRESGETRMYQKEPSQPEHQIYDWVWHQSDDYPTFLLYYTAERFQFEEDYITINEIKLKKK